MDSIFECSCKDKETVTIEVSVSPSSGSAVLSYLVITSPSGSVGLPYIAGLTQSLSEAVKIRKQLQ